jgi:hypothetical protein
MAATAYGEAHIVFGASPPTITLYGKDGVSIGAGYVNPDLAEATLEVVFDSSNYTNTAGEICARRTKGEHLRATFQVIPNAATIADAKLAAMIPGEGWSFTISGMHAIRAGTFTNAFNVTSPTTDRPWFVESGSIRGSIQDPAGVTFSAVRIYAITTNAPTSEA